MHFIVYAILFLPLLGAIINGFLGRRFSKGLVGWIACGSVGIAFLLSVLSLLEMESVINLFAQFPADVEHKSLVAPLFDWISVGDFSVNFSLLLDPLSMLMLMVITGVGFLIHVYSVGYMAHDKDFSRYFAFLNLFSFSMLALVLADNFLLLFFGWEMVGLCSYLLIGFWFNKESAALAAKKAFIVNRIGDFGFLLGIFLIFAVFGTLDYAGVFGAAEGTLVAGGIAATAIGLLLFVGAAGKSAQIPLYVWLPDAMEGPTPVSALIHAATMVTAGVYMIARTHVLYGLAPDAMAVVALLGALTAILAAAIAIGNNDIKRVLAYSTVSQLGYMFLAVGVGAYSAAMFHMTSHAFMKALLFLAAGSVMHAMSDETDIRKMGGLKDKIPVTWIVFLVGVLAMSGIPPLVGFFSKDLILENVFFAPGGTLLWVIGVATALMTAFYLLRAYLITFHGEARYDKSEVHPHESPPVMLWPLRILAAASVLGGVLWIALPGVGWAPLEHFLESVVHTVHHDVEASTLWMLLGISVIVALGGIGLAFAVYGRGFGTEDKLKRLGPVHGLLENKFYVDELYDYVFVKPLRVISRVFAWVVDLMVIDGIVRGIAKLIDRAGGALRGLQVGYIRSYAAWVVLGTIGIIAYFILR